MKERSLARIRLVVTASIVLGSAGLSACKKSVDEPNVFEEPSVIKWMANCNFLDHPFLAGQYIETESERQIAQEKFTEAITFMNLSAQIKLNQVAQAYTKLKNEGFVVDEPFLLGPETVNTIFYGGFPDLKSSSYKIVVSLEALSSQEIDSVSLSLYLYKTFLVFDQLRLMDGNAATKVVVDSREIEARAWIDTFDEVFKSLDIQLNDPYIKSLYTLYRSLGKEDFVRCWRGEISTQR